MDTREQEQRLDTLTKHLNKAIICSRRRDGFDEIEDDTFFKIVPDIAEGLILKYVNKYPGYTKEKVTKYINIYFDVDD